LRRRRAFSFFFPPLEAFFSSVDSVPLRLGGASALSAVPKGRGYFYL
jgi:hypothetical protein